MSGWKKVPYKNNDNDKKTKYVPLCKNGPNCTFRKCKFGHPERAERAERENKWPRENSTYRTTINTQRHNTPRVPNPFCVSYNTYGYCSCKEKVVETHPALCEKHNCSCNKPHGFVTDYSLCPQYKKLGYCTTNACNASHPPLCKRFKISIDDGCDCKFFHVEIPNGTICDSIFAQKPCKYGKCCRFAHPSICTSFERDCQNEECDLPHKRELVNDDLYMNFLQLEADKWDKWLKEYILPIAKNGEEQCIFHFLKYLFKRLYVQPFILLMNQYPRVRRLITSKNGSYNMNLLSHIIWVNGESSIEEDHRRFIAFKQLLESETVKIDSLNNQGENIFVSLNHEQNYISSELTKRIYDFILYEWNINVREVERLIIQLKNKHDVFISGFLLFRFPEKFFTDYTKMFFNNKNKSTLNDSYLNDIKIDLNDEHHPAYDMFKHVVNAENAVDFHRSRFLNIYIKALEQEYYIKPVKGKDLSPEQKAAIYADELSSILNLDEIDKSIIKLIINNINDLKLNENRNLFPLVFSHTFRLTLDKDLLPGEFIQHCLSIYNDVNTEKRVKLLLEVNLDIVTPDKVEADI